jgi:ubiquinol-cytochrome c reductase cytochrome b subunit
MRRSSRTSPAALAIQVLTGIFLWLAYSPSSQTAWESVFYIQHVMAGGWFVRGLHHFTAQAMTVLLVIHLLQVVIDGAYQAPREVNYWTGLVLLLLVLGLSLTGYLLPWDQKGYWATRVATNIVAVTPVIGGALQRIIVGGTDYGHHTLTRFFALHAGVLPGLIIAFIVGHVYLFRRHGIKAKEPRRRPDAAFWPDQVLRDGVACLAVLAVVLFLTIRAGGAPLAAPADASQLFSAARPEWYFLFLFQFLKYFPGGTEVWGAIIIPIIVVGLVAALPVFARFRQGHRMNLAMIWVLIGAAGAMTVAAMREDRANPAYLAAVERAEAEAERAVVLARAPAGIPPTGAAALLRSDPLIQGPRLFAANCASCHRYEGHNGLGVALTEPQEASDLKGFASREWITGLLDWERILTPNYFGATWFTDGLMVHFVQDDLPFIGDRGREQLPKAIMALSAEAALPAQREADLRDAELIVEGREHLLNTLLNCTECHTIFGEGGEDGPRLTGYGSREWLIDFISDPAQEHLYGEWNDGMPRFGAERRLTEGEIGVLADWIRGDWYEPDR